MKSLATHAGQLERWLGREVVEDLSKSMANWYGPPIAVAGVPGKVFAHAGGDFRGRIASGKFSTGLCMAEDWLRRLPRALSRSARKQAHVANAGFASLSDLITEGTTGGKRREWWFKKDGTTGVVACANSLWRCGNLPAAGAAAAAAPGGTVPDKTTTGALANFDNVSTDTRHFVSAWAIADASPRNLMLYDRLFAVAKTMSDTNTEAVTGVPTRYQSTTATDPDSACGNFLFIECGTQLSGTSHNWTVCTYKDQGNADSTLPSLTGNSGNIINRLDHPASNWFAPLAAGDVGIKALTQMQCSASVSGNVDFVIGHPLVVLPIQVTALACVTDGVNTAFNLVRIFDDACLAFLEMPRSSTGSTFYNGSITTVAG